MADPVTISAIVGAVTAAGVAAATTAATEASKEGSGVAATIINESKHSFTVESYATNHGHWIDHPSHTVSSVQDILKILRNETEVHLGKASVTDKEMSDYFKQKYQLPGIAGSFVRSTVTSFEMKGAGIGSEGVVLMYPIGKPKSVIGLLIRKIPGGSFGAGVDIGLVAQWNRMHLLPNQDEDGSKLIKYIKNHGKQTMVKFSEGKTMTAVNSGIKIKFAAAESVEFVVYDK